MEAITNKRQMYRHLARGDFGNTIRQHFGISEWLESGESERFKMWGVRSLIPGGPCRLHVPTSDVPGVAESPDFVRAGVNISAMVDSVSTVTLWADVYDSDTGLQVYGIEYPYLNGGRSATPSWRKDMPRDGRSWKGLAALGMLRKHLNASSFADLEVLRDTYHGHVYELSALGTCLGTVPGRNAVIWEVRKY